MRRILGIEPWDFHGVTFRLYVGCRSGLGLLLDRSNILRLFVICLYYEFLYDLGSILLRSWFIFVPIVANFSRPWLAGKDARSSRVPNRVLSNSIRRIVFFMRLLIATVPVSSRAGSSRVLDCGHKSRRAVYARYLRMNENGRGIKRRSGGT